MDWRLGLRVVASCHDTLGAHRHPKFERRRSIWRRFPKFVLGFLIASAIVTVISRGYDYAAYKKEVVTGLVAPLQALRTWAFTFAFLSIGLTTRLREFVSVGARPLSRSPSG